MDVGLRIKFLRKDLNMTMQQLSELTEISQPVLSKLENGNRIADIPTLEKICFALGITLAEFFNEEKQPLPLHIQELIEVTKSLPKDDIRTLTRLIKRND